jgi:ketosteroid isomerase-like protein
MAGDPLTVVEAWAQAYSRRDLDAMLALSCPDIEVARRLRHEQGHAAVRGLLHRQSFGVEMHPRVRRMFHRGDTVVVDAQLVVSYVARYVPYPDLDSALSDAGLGEDDEVR